MTQTVTSDHAIDPAIARRAAEWMARLWSDHPSDADKQAFAQWRTAHPDHETAWQRLQVLEDKLHRLPNPLAHGILRTPSGKTDLARRRALQLLGLIASAGGAACLVRETEVWQIATADHRTKTGEIREVVLPDGSRMILSTATAVDIRFDRHERRIVLRHGEIMLITAKDIAHRPLLVQSRQGTIQALGTRFTVRQEEHLSHVAVYEGMVEMRPSQHPDKATRIAAGYGASLSATDTGNVMPALEEQGAWTRGFLIAENMRIADFVAELQRYRPGLLRCDPAVANLQVSGVFSVQDTDRALDNLTLSLPVSLRYRTRYWVTVQARSKNSVSD